jgi:broad specificity phosphatase PhoE
MVIETQIPPFMAKHIEKVPRDRPVVVLVRHAARGPLPPGEPGDTVPITDEGRRSALQFGEILRERLLRLRTSPIPRCVQTADALQAGAATNLEIVRDSFLGDPGVYVTDVERAWLNWQQLGHDGVMQHLATSAQALPGMAQPDDACWRLVRHTLQCAGDEPGLHLFVSHDSLVVATAARLLGMPLHQEDWPTYLEGVFLWQMDDDLHVRYRDFERIRHIP